MDNMNNEDDEDDDLYIQVDTKYTLDDDDSLDKVCDDGMDYCSLEMIRFYYPESEEEEDYNSLSDNRK